MTSQASTWSCSQPRPTRFQILGVEVEALNMDQLNAIVADAVANGKRIIVGNHNLHSLYHYHHDPKMRSFYAAADHIHVDGMAIIGLGRLLGVPLEREHRVTYVDWMGPLVQAAAEHGWRVFYLGSRPGVAEIGADVLVRSIPACKWKRLMVSSTRTLPLLKRKQ